MGHNMPNNLGKIIFPNKANYGPNDRADLGLQTGFKESNLLNHLNDLSFTTEKDEGMARVWRRMRRAASLAETSGGTFGCVRLSILLIFVGLCKSANDLSINVVKSLI
jgi:hypothetical protein